MERLDHQTGPAAESGTPEHARLAARSVMQEGVLAGIIAATGVALWFLAVDVLAGTPLLTPRTLGYGLGTLLDIREIAASPAVAVLAYTIVHYAAFAALGLGAAAVVRIARRQATVLAGALLVFIVAELAFAGAVALLRQVSMSGELTWPELVAGNIVGCALLAASLWRWHPELRGELAAAMKGTGSWSVR